MLSKIGLINVQLLLKTEREKRFMSFEDVAKGLGCSSSYVFRIEKGKRKKPSYEIVSKMINLFELSDEDLDQYIPEDVLEEVSKTKTLESGIIQFCKKMDTNSLIEVQELLEKVKALQKESAQTTEAQQKN